MRLLPQSEPPVAASRRPPWHDAGVTTVGIIGGGKAAMLHADTALQMGEIELVGGGGRPGTAGQLAEDAGVPDLALPLLCEAEVVIIAVPPSEVAGVTRLVGNEVQGGAPVRAVLIEPPLRLVPELSIPTVLAANLLHAPVVKQALRAIGTMKAPHHLQLRVRQPAPTWGAHGTPAFGGPLHDPGIRLASLLLAAAAETAVHVERVDIEGGVHAAIELESGRRAGLDVAWVEGSSRIELEAADDGGVLLLTLDPLPRLEVDGRPIDSPDLHPLEALGFVGQLDRLSRTADGATPWPSTATGLAIEGLFGVSADHH